MRALGWAEADIVEVDVDDTTAKALAIALNRSAELATWEKSTLGVLLDALQGEFPLGDLGFDQKELDDLIQREPVPVEDPRPHEPPENATTKNGDMWILGDHRLLCGDSTTAADVARLLASDTPSLLSTDPPELRAIIPHFAGHRPGHEPDGPGAPPDGIGVSPRTKGRSGGPPNGRSAPRGDHSSHIIAPAWRTDRSFDGDAEGGSRPYRDDRRTCGQRLGMTASLRSSDSTAS
jgi:hypothetical protein